MRLGKRMYPDNFIWGAASTPACCEGETVSDWGRLSAPDGSVPDDGPKHWRRYRFDFRAMADIGLTAYRFGCDWARLQRGPYEPFVRDDLFRYLEMLAELRSRRIEPWLVLFQNALPRWATKAGGWLHEDTPYWFADYARRLADATDGEVRHWITVHEPQLYAFGCHGWGVLPGGSWGRLDRVRTVLKNLVLGHTLAMKELRQRLPECKVGVALSGGGFSPKRKWHPCDRAAATVTEWCLNGYGRRRFLRAGDGCDFVMLRTGNEIGIRAREGLSMSSLVSMKVAERMHSPGKDAVDAKTRCMQLRRRISTCRVPVYLTGGVEEENGNLESLLSVCKDNPDAAGFFYEPLLDQFDLLNGLGRRRGLLSVDFHSSDRRREPRDLARRFSRLIRKDAL